jgi:hypothetical protein
LYKNIADEHTSPVCPCSSQLLAIIKNSIQSKDGILISEFARIPIQHSHLELKFQDYLRFQSQFDPILFAQSPSAFVPATFPLDKDEATDGRRDGGPLYPEINEVCDICFLSSAGSIKVEGGGPKRVTPLVPPFEVERKLATDAGCLKGALVGWFPKL